MPPGHPLPTLSRRAQQPPMLRPGKNWAMDAWNVATRLVSRTSSPSSSAFSALAVAVVASASCCSWAISAEICGVETAGSACGGLARLWPWRVRAPARRAGRPTPTYTYLGGARQQVTLQCALHGCGEDVVQLGGEVVALCLALLCGLQRRGRRAGLGLAARWAKPSCCGPLGHMGPLQRKALALKLGDALRRLPTSGLSSSSWSWARAAMAG